MKGLYMCLLIFLILCGLTGCVEGKRPVEHITSVKIESTGVLEKFGRNVAFNEKQFNDKENLILFQRVIENLIKIEGGVDYSSYFLMTATFEDNSQEEYALNVSDSEESGGGKALFFYTRNQEQAYYIPESLTKKLRTILFIK